MFTFTFWLEWIYFVTILLGFRVRTPLLNCLSSCIFNTCTFLTEQTSTIVNTASQTPSDINEYQSISSQQVIAILTKIYEDLIERKQSKSFIWLLLSIFIKVNFTKNLLNMRSSNFAYLGYPCFPATLWPYQISTVYRFQISGSLRNIY